MKNTFYSFLSLLLLLFARNQTGEEPLVAEAAAEIQNYCFNYRDQLLAGIIVAGWDKQKGGQVYQVPLGGMCIRRNYAIGGSGSSYVHGFIREFYREGMSRNETVEFVKKGNDFTRNVYRDAIGLTVNLYRKLIFFSLHSYLACHVLRR